MATFWGANLDFGRANRRTGKWHESKIHRCRRRQRRRHGVAGVHAGTIATVTRNRESRGASRRGVNSIGRHTPRATSHSSAGANE